MIKNYSYYFRVLNCSKIIICLKYLNITHRYNRCIKFHKKILHITKSSRYFVSFIKNIVPSLFYVYFLTVFAPPKSYLFSKHQLCLSLTLIEHLCCILRVTTNYCAITRMHWWLPQPIWVPLWIPPDSLSPSPPLQLKKLNKSWKKLNL